MNENASDTQVWNVDTKGFELVFKTHYVKLTLYANRFLNDIDISKEIASESLTFLWEMRGTLSFTNSVSAYLYKMVKNNNPLFSIAELSPGL